MRRCWQSYVYILFICVVLSIIKSSTGFNNKLFVENQFGIENNNYYQNIDSIRDEVPWRINFTRNSTGPLGLIEISITPQRTIELDWGDFELIFDVQDLGIIMKNENDPVTTKQQILLFDNNPTVPGLDLVPTVKNTVFCRGKDLMPYGILTVPETGFWDGYQYYYSLQFATIQPTINAGTKLTCWFRTSTSIIKDDIHITDRLFYIEPGFHNTVHHTLFDEKNTFRFNILNKPISAQVTSAKFIGYDRTTSLYPDFGRMGILRINFNGLVNGGVYPIQFGKLFLTHQQSNKTTYTVGINQLLVNYPPGLFIAERWACHGISTSSNNNNMNNKNNNQSYTPIFNGAGGVELHLYWDTSVLGEIDNKNQGVTFAVHVLPHFQNITNNNINTAIQCDIPIPIDYYFKHVIDHKTTIATCPIAQGRDITKLDWDVISDELLNSTISIEMGVGWGDVNKIDTNRIDITSTKNNISVSSNTGLIMNIINLDRIPHNFLSIHNTRTRFMLYHTPPHLIDSSTREDQFSALTSPYETWYTAHLIDYIKLFDKNQSITQYFKNNLKILRSIGYTWSFSDWMRDMYLISGHTFNIDRFLNDIENDDFELLTMQFETLMNSLWLHYELKIYTITIYTDSTGSRVVDTQIQIPVNNFGDVIYKEEKLIHHTIVLLTVNNLEKANKQQQTSSGVHGVEHEIPARTMIDVRLEKHHIRVSPLMPALAFDEILTKVDSITNSELTLHMELVLSYFGGLKPDDDVGGECCDFDTLNQNKEIRQLISNNNNDNNDHEHQQQHKSTTCQSDGELVIGTLNTRIPLDHHLQFFFGQSGVEMMLFNNKKSNSQYQQHRIGADPRLTPYPNKCVILINGQQHRIVRFNKENQQQPVIIVEDHSWVEHTNKDYVNLTFVNAYPQTTDNAKASKTKSYLDDWTYNTLQITGYLKIGSALSFMCTWPLVQGAKGDLIDLKVNILSSTQNVAKLPCGGRFRTTYQTIIPDILTLKKVNNNNENDTNNNNANNKWLINPPFNMNTQKMTPTNNTNINNTTTNNNNQNPYYMMCDTLLHVMIPDTYQLDTANDYIQLKHDIVDIIKRQIIQQQQLIINSDDHLFNTNQTAVLDQEQYNNSNNNNNKNNNNQFDNITIDDLTSLKLLTTSFYDDISDDYNDNDNYDNNFYFPTEIIKKPTRLNTIQSINSRSNSNVTKLIRFGISKRLNIGQYFDIINNDGNYNNYNASGIIFVGNHSNINNTMNTDLILHFKALDYYDSDIINFDIDNKNNINNIDYLYDIFSTPENPLSGKQPPTPPSTPRGNKSKKKKEYDFIHNQHSIFNFDNPLGSTCYSSNQCSSRSCSKSSSPAAVACVDGQCVDLHVYPGLSPILYEQVRLFEYGIVNNNNNNNNINNHNNNNNNNINNNYNEMNLNDQSLAPPPPPPPATIEFPKHIHPTFFFTYNWDDYQEDIKIVQPSLPPSSSSISDEDQNNKNTTDNNNNTDTTPSTPTSDVVIVITNQTNTSPQNKTESGDNHDNIDDEEDQQRDTEVGNTTTNDIPSDNHNNNTNHTDELSGFDSDDDDDDVSSLPPQTQNAPKKNNVLKIPMMMYFTEAGVLIDLCIACIIIIICNIMWWYNVQN